MTDRVIAAFGRSDISLVAPLPLSYARILRPYLLSKSGISESGTVFVFAVPYYTRACDDTRRNVSAYAVGLDYHFVIKALCDNIINELKAEFPDNKFAVFTDHSPIDEVHDAAMCSLGVIGENGLLITEKYSSYVFLGGLFTDARIDFPCDYNEAIKYCEGCGLCRAACPVSLSGREGCLSALTQKKGELSENERAVVASAGYVWGCDICSAVCPHTKNAIASGSIYAPDSLCEAFGKPIAHIDADALHNMSDGDFSRRAYSWRGREVIFRNITVISEEKATEKKHK